MAEKRPDEVFSQRAAHYATSVVHDDAEMLSRIVAMCSPLPQHVALDVGTGTFHTAMALAPRVGRVVALDLTREMVMQGIRLAKERGIGNIHPCLAEAEHLPVTAGSVNIVTCRRAAHHFLDLPKALREMHRALRLDGVLVIDDRSVPEDAKLDAFINHLDSLHDPSHVRERPVSEWRSLLLDAGFSIMEVQTYVRHRSLSSYAVALEPDRRRLMLDHVLTADDDTVNGAAIDLSKADPSWDHFFLTVRARKA